MLHTDEHSQMSETTEWNRRIFINKRSSFRNFIPEVDGHSWQKLQQFINANTYAMEKINFAEKPALLEEF